MITLVIHILSVKYGPNCIFEPKIVLTQKSSHMLDIFDNAFLAAELALLMILISISVIKKTPDVSDKMCHMCAIFANALFALKLAFLMIMIPVSVRERPF